MYFTSNLLPGVMVIFLASITIYNS
jgi:hypothetical protein